MCSTCWKTPCHPRCPYADEPKAIFDCELCKGGITEGDEYVEINGDKYHYDCLDTIELLKIIGATKKTCTGDEL